jgi:SH3-like domain-containing protein
LAVLKVAASAYSQEKRRVFEKPIFQLGKGEVVEVVTTAKPMSQVRTRSGRSGWVETEKLDTVNRPPILALIPADTAKAPLTTPKEDSAIAKKWIESTKAGEKDSAK